MSSLFIAATLSIFICFSNFLTIAAVYCEPKLRRNLSNYFIASLAAADLLIGCISIPMDTYYHHMMMPGEYPALFCDVFQAIHLTSGLASIWHLIAISAERYFSITKSLAYRKWISAQKAMLLILFLWFGAALYAALCLLGQKIDETRNVNNCDFLRGPKLYTIALMIIFFSLPSVALVYFYVKLYRAAARNRRCISAGVKICDSSTACPVSIRYNRSREGSKETSTSGGDSDLVRKNSSDREKRLSEAVAAAAREYRAALLVGTVIGAFMACWYPAAGVYLYRLFCTDCPTLGTSFQLVYPWLGWFNSALNPVIYMLLSDDFRGAFLNILCTCELRVRH